MAFEFSSNELDEGFIQELTDQLNLLGVNTEKIKNTSAPLGVLTGTNVVVVDTVTKVISFASTTVLMDRKNAIFVEGHSSINNYESIVASNRVGVIIFDTIDKKFEYVDFESAEIADRYLIIGYFQNNSFFGQLNKASVIIKTSSGPKKDIGTDDVSPSLIKASISGDQIIDFDLDNGTINWKDANIVAGGIFGTINNQTTQLINESGIQYITYNSDTNKVEMKMFHHTFDKDTCYYLGSLRQNAGLVSVDFPYRVKKNGEWTTNLITERVESKVISLPRTPVIFDYDAGVIQFPEVHIMERNDKFITFPGGNVSFDKDSALIQYIYLDRNSNNIFTIKAFESTPPNCTLLAAIRGGGIDSVSADFPYKIKNKDEWFSNVMTDRVESKLVLLPQWPVTVDFYTGKITFPQTHVMQRKDNFTTINPCEVTFNKDSGMIQYVYLKREDSTVVTIEAFQPYPADAVLIGALRGGGINSVSFDFPHIKKGTSDATEYDVITNRLLLPDRIFLSDDMSMNVYKSSISPTNEHGPYYKTAACVNGVDFDYFDSLKLIPSEVGNKITIAIEQKENTAVFYKKEIDVSIADASSKAGSSPTICFLGDSLTYNDTPAYAKRNLSLRNITANIIGTVPNGQASDGDGTVYTAKSEGRASWSFSDFVGRRNRSAWGNPVQRVTTKVDETTLEQNPYLKLATDEDKQQHPTWCFRNTGADLEKSYADDPDKSGDFFIFDFKFFLDTQELPTPDLVTIALGTNDYWKFGNDFLTSCKLGLDIMVRQIKKYYPEIKIGIVAGQARGTTDDGIYNYSSYTASLIENVCSMVREYQSEFTDITVIPVWMHQSNEFIFEGEKQDLSPINNVQKIDKGDTTHFIAIGRDQYAKATTAWVMNQI